MSKRHEVILADQERIALRLRRSERRTLAISVQPDLEVIVTAPRKAKLEAILAKVRKRGQWIQQQQQYFRDFLPQTPARRYVSGETHLYLGRQYRLKVVEGSTPEVKLRGRFIWVKVQRKSDRARVRNVMERWYSERAKERLTRSFSEGVVRLGPRFKQAPRMHVRRMSKRWGSWTRRGGIWLNPELVKAPPSCIDYVVTHELCHAVHGNHGREFYQLLRRVMPDWEQRKARLERAAVA